MAAATKIAAFGAILRIFYVGFANAEWQWKPALVVIAIITMIFGSVVAITQRDVKRMLAYSSIAHMGYLLIALIAVLTMIWLSIRALWLMSTTKAIETTPSVPPSGATSS